MDEAYDIQIGNPDYGNIKRLICRDVYFLSILPNEKVLGIDDDAGENSEFQILEFTSAGSEEGVLRIRGVNSNLYLCMDEEGNLYGEKDPGNDATVFIESFLGSYSTYLSKKYEDKNWFVGLKKNGLPKPADRTDLGQSAIKFIPIYDET